MVQEYTVGPTGFRVPCPRKPGAILETGSLHPPLAALHLFPLLGLSPHQEPPCGGCAPKHACGRSPAHTLHPQGVCSIRKAAQPLTAALPFRCGESTSLSTASPLIVSKTSFWPPCRKKSSPEGSSRLLCPYTGNRLFFSAQSVIMARTAVFVSVLGNSS